MAVLSIPLVIATFINTFDCRFHFHAFLLWGPMNFRYVLSHGLWWDAILLYEVATTQHPCCSCATWQPQLCYTYMVAGISTSPCFSTVFRWLRQGLSQRSLSLQVLDSPSPLSYVRFLSPQETADKVPLLICRSAEQIIFFFLKPITVEMKWFYLGCSLVALFVILLGFLPSILRIFPSFPIVPVFFLLPLSHFVLSDDPISPCLIPPGRE